MRFIAIMIDSYKEAVSGWVLQTLMILAGLLMIFVIGLSFEPLSPEDDIDRQLRLITLFTHNDPNAGKAEMGVENFIQTNAPEPYMKGDYKFEAYLRTPSKEDLDKAREVLDRNQSPFGEKLPPASGEDIVKQYVKDSAPYLQNVTTETVKSDKPGEVRVKFTTKGTDIDDPLAWKSKPKLFFSWTTGPIFWMSLRQAVYRVEKTMVNDIGAWLAMLISVVVTAGFIPNMLRKGSLDLYIAKPIGRIELLLYKYVGGLTFVFLLAAFTVGGVWLVVGLRTGVWSPNFLVTIFVLTFYFAILYAISTAMAVLTRSTLVAILVTILVWGLVYGIGFAHDTCETINKESKKNFVKLKKQQGQEGVNPEDAKAVQPVPEWVENGLYAARKVLPRTYDTDVLSGRLIAKGVLTDKEMKDKKYDEEPSSDWPEVLIVSFLHIAGLMALACWRITSRDG